ncbi:hypothetical protein, partial [Aromatoleum aromaticum]|uniref:hypothetical protein n=1 Tax=Aromatoleum aromaticum TaxID=551760 RepID=UPI001B7CEB39
MAGAQWDVAALHIHHERCVQSVSICPPPTTGGQRERHDGLDVNEEFGRSDRQAGRLGAEMSSSVSDLSTAGAVSGGLISQCEKRSAFQVPISGFLSEIAMPLS